MSEFCKTCYLKYHGGTEKDLRRLVLNRAPELCEGCGRFRPVVIKLRQPLWKRLIPKKYRR